MNLSLKGKNAVVCGSTQGIGFAVARVLSELGAGCILMARNEQALIEAMNSLSCAEGQRHEYFVADFTKPQEVQKAITDCVSRHAIHILINNTGGPPAGPILEADEYQFLIAFQQHLICNHILVRAVVPSMKQVGYGRIINIISTSVKIPLNNLGVSNTIRGAVASWAKTLANELGQYNITVNNILPGFTQTLRLETLIKNMALRENTGVDIIVEKLKQEVPMKRFGEPEEIANVAAFLATPAASYVNGASIPVDGGRTGSI
ncbi:MAG: SDR family oxidoreductase [Chitinophagaceae bacterium]|nr:SDR family oxidoreductase [Chitinophagaceae bacterium]